MLMAESSMDQAEGLRHMSKPSPVRVISVVSGKGGVGKTNVSCNLAMSLAMQDKKVMVLDADLGLGNIDVMLGLHPSYNLAHVISGERTLEEIIVEGPFGMKIVPASSGVEVMAGLSPEQHAGLVRAFSELHDRIDVLLIDAAAGISDDVLTFSRAAQEVLVVVCDEPASITDAYALIKVLNQDHGLRHFRVLVNQVASVQDGRELFAKLIKVTDRFLDVTLELAGTVPFDELLKKAVKKQKAVVDAYPRSRASLAFKKLAQAADKWPMAKVAGGHLEFFVERLLQGDTDQWMGEQVI
jgi:flagellar biosynthesis protein FlhG